VIFTSALTKQRVLKALEEAVTVYQNRKKRVSTSELNEFLQETIENYPPPAVKGKLIHIKYATQLPNQACPTFVFFCNSPQYVKDPYRRYLENKLREKFDFSGSPLRIFMRQK
jgi:GTP-binding protein